LGPADTAGTGSNEGAANIGGSMACIYNEKVERKGTPLLLVLIAVTLSLLIASYLSKAAGVAGTYRLIVDSVLVMGFLYLMYSSFHMSKECYRYSIIADDLLIHRMSGDKPLLVERVKVADIRYFGEVGKNPEVSRVRGSNYTCEFMKGRYCLVYEDGGREKKFFFKPSTCMIGKIQNSMKLYR
jgi:hypothetical protein